VAGKLAGKVAIVTGGARGIGGQIATAFAAEGADVVIADVLGADAAAPVLAAIAGSGRRHLLVRTDVSDEQQVRAMVDVALAEFGQVDILVNDAGVVGQRSFAELEVSEWDRVIAVNLRGVFLCTRFVLPGMLERKHGSSMLLRSWARSAGWRWCTTAPAKPG
jgi:3-oxoacyl-[acyl-carrier protein] reductase